MSRQCPSCGTSHPDDVSSSEIDAAASVQQQDREDVDPRLGEELGEYVLVARVADGAMGRVYEGRHSKTGERVAIKILHPHVANEPVSVERFKREYETALELDHRHIIQVSDFGQTPDESYFLIMEYLDGQELSETISASTILPKSRVVRVVCQLATALEHAHSYGVIHRDLKPENVFLSSSPQGVHVKVLDFGSVKLQMETGPKLTAFGTTLGSPYYMSPEQAMGKLDVDQRTDVFAMAAIVYEMLSGRVPFEGQTVAEILMKLVKDDPAPLAGVPPVLRDALFQALSKDKAQRPAGCGDLANRILSSLGLSGDYVQWSETSEEELARALSSLEAEPGIKQGSRAPSIAPSSTAKDISKLPAQRMSSIPSGFDQGFGMNGRPSGLLFGGLAVFGFAVLVGLFLFVSQ
ncbi:MAG: serine/threonine-protein kinase [Myxococcota bacterium]